MSQQEHFNSEQREEEMVLDKKEIIPKTQQPYLFELGDDLAIKLIKEKSQFTLSELERKYKVNIQINQDYGQIQIIPNENSSQENDIQRKMIEIRNSITNIALDLQKNIEETYIFCNKDFFGKISRALKNDHKEIPDQYQLNFLGCQSSEAQGFKEYLPSITRQYTINSKYTIKLCKLEQPEYLSFDQIDVLLINMTCEGLFLDDFGYQLAQSNKSIKNLINASKDKLKTQALVDESIFISGNKKVSLLIQTINDEQQCIQNLWTILGKLKNQEFSQKGCLRLYLGVRDVCHKDFFEEIFNYIAFLENNNYLQTPSEINFIVNERYEKCFQSIMEQQNEKFQNTNENPFEERQMVQNNYQEDNSKAMKNLNPFNEQQEPLLHIRATAGILIQINELIEQLKNKHYVNHEIILQYGALSEELVQYIKEIGLKQNMQITITDEKVIFHAYRKTLNKYLPIIQNRIRATGKNQLFYPTPVNWDPQTDNLKLVELSLTNSESLECMRMIKVTLPHAKVLRVQRVQNLKLWRNYQFEKKKLEQKGNAAERMLFHGTRNNKPELIYNGTEEGFDFRLSAHGSYGRGTYFSEMASYSQSYAYHKQSGASSVLQFFVANVLIGNYASVGGSNYVSPPVIPGTNGLRYDSVRSNGAEGQNMFIVYHNSKAYPTYLIDFRQS